MSGIFTQKSYYKELKCVIDEALAKVATVYEKSKVCSNDQLVIGKITVNTSIINVLSGMISGAIEISDIKNYENTNESLNSLAVKVNDLITKLEELGELINTKSMETYTELYDSYITLKLDYANKCSTLNTLFSEYERYSNTYSNLSSQIASTIQTNPEYQSLCRKRDQAAKNRENCLVQIEEFLKKLNSVKQELQKLLADGLQKYSI